MQSTGETEFRKYFLMTSVIARIPAYQFIGEVDDVKEYTRASISLQQRLSKQRFYNARMALKDSLCLSSTRDQHEEIFSCYHYVYKHIHAYNIYAYIIYIYIIRIVLYTICTLSFFVLCRDKTHCLIYLFSPLLHTGINDESKKKNIFIR